MGCGPTVCVFWGDSFPDITLAFCGTSGASWLRLPEGISCLLEALTDSVLELHYADHCPFAQDLVEQWLLDLHLVRHPVGAEARLASLVSISVPTRAASDSLPA